MNLEVEKGRWSERGAAASRCRGFGCGRLAYRQGSARGFLVV